MTTQILLIVLAILMLAVSCFFGLKIWSFNRRKAASAGWPIIAADVVSRDISSRRNSKTNVTSYRANVTYRYAAPGGPIEKKLFLGSKNMRDQAEKLVDDVGETIQVHYNPEKPAENFSDYEKTMPVDVITMIVSLILAVILVVLAFI